VLVGTVSFIFSCSKDDISRSDKNKTTSDILIFNNYEEFDEALGSIFTMNEQQRKDWEESNGFKSFGIKCDEIYKKANPEKFKNLDDFKAFVAQNSDYIGLIEEENGELTLEVVLSKSPLRYFLNKDRMYGVDNNIYKVLENGSIKTNRENLEKLRAINEQNLLSYKSNPDFSIILNETEDLYNSEKYYDCGKHSKDWNDNGNDRTTLWLDLQEYDCGYGGYVCSYWRAEIQIRPYHKILGVWYYASRSISWDCKCIVEWRLSSGCEACDNSCGGWTVVDNLRSYSTSPVSDSYIYRELWRSGTMPGDWLCRHFSAIKIWADTPSTGPAAHNCNTGAIDF